jgi:hypothetical protein
MTASSFTSYSAQSVNGSVVLTPTANSLNLAYSLQNVDPKCTRPAAITHSCGLQLLPGNCSTATGYVMSNDPWNNATYKSDIKGNAYGRVNLYPSSGYNFSAGCVVLIYDSTGKPLACAPIPVGTRGYY